MRYLSKMCVQKSILWRGPFKYNSHCAHDPMLILIWMPVCILNGQIYLFWWRECFSLVSLLFHVNSVYNAQFMQSKNVPLLVDILIVWIKWVIVWNRQSVNCFVRLLLLFFCHILPLQNVNVWWETDWWNHFLIPIDPLMLSV